MAINQEEPSLQNFLFVRWWYTKTIVRLEEKGGRFVKGSYLSITCTFIYKFTWSISLISSYTCAALERVYRDARKLMSHKQKRRQSTLVIPHYHSFCQNTIRTVWLMKRGIYYVPGIIRAYTVVNNYLLHWISASIKWKSWGYCSANLVYSEPLILYCLDFMFVRYIDTAFNI